MNVDDYIREWYCKHHLDTREIAQKMLDDLGISRSKSWVLSRVHALGIVRDRSQANKIKWTKTPCHKRIDIPPEDLNKAIELYNEGHGTPYIKSNLNLKCSHQVLQKNLARAGCQLRNSKDAAKASPNLTRPVIKLQDDTQFRLIRSYEMGESYYALAQVYGHAPDTIKRILIENDVRIRTHAEACSLRSAQKRSEREAKELESLKPLISKNYNLIRKSIRSFVRTSQRKLFLNRDVEDVVDGAIRYVPPVALKWSKKGGINFVWYVSKYSLLRYYDTEVRSQWRPKKRRANVTSLDRVMPSGSTLHEEVPTTRKTSDRLPEDIVWQETKTKLIREARLMVKAHQLPKLALGVLTDYYFPLVETGSAPRMKDLASRKGFTESYYSRVSKHPNLKYLVSEVLNRG